MAAKVKRQPANVLCVMCGAPVASCSIPGLHGMLRDRARAAADQAAAQKAAAR